jgi:hypothetical protein
MQQGMLSYLIINLHLGPCWLIVVALRQCMSSLCLQELLAIQQAEGPLNVGFFGTRNMGVTHQKLVEILSYAYASTVSAYGFHRDLGPIVSLPGAMQLAFAPSQPLSWLKPTVDH